MLIQCLRHCSKCQQSRGLIVTPGTMLRNDQPLFAVWIGRRPQEAVSAVNRRPFMSKHVSFSVIRTAHACLRPCHMHLRPHASPYAGTLCAALSQYSKGHHACRHSPKLLLTSALTLLSNSGFRSLHILAASTFAGLSSFGSAIMLITEMRIFSTDCIGLHRSEACS